MSRSASTRVRPSGLVGPNGAGKTTLFDCLNGVRHSDSGEICLRGTAHRPSAGLRACPSRDRAHVPAPRAVRRDEPPRAPDGRRAGAPRRRPAVEGPDRPRDGRESPWHEVEDLLAELGLEEVADDPIESLSQGHGRLVELGRALVQDPRLLLLDEPSSGLDTREAVGFAVVLLEVRARRKTAMLLVEHDLDFVAARCRADLRARFRQDDRVRPGRRGVGRPSRAPRLSRGRPRDARRREAEPAGGPRAVALDAARARAA